MTGPVTIEQLTDVRATAPERVAAALRDRRRAARFAGPDGRLLLIAADHPARGVLAAGGRADAMASRPELLRRLVTALARPGVDGVLGTADVIEDLALLGALDGKVVAGSMNRGGLGGSAFEIDDRMTGYDVRGVVDGGLDAGKLLLRIDLADPATPRALATAGEAVTALAREGRVALVEPFMSRRDADGRLGNDLGVAAVVRSVHVAAGLGATSARTWLKLPVLADAADMARVADATTLPVLLLGGDPAGAPDDTYARWERSLALPGVRGLVVGRSLLYPRDDDVAAAVDTAARLVRGGRR